MFAWRRCVRRACVCAGCAGAAAAALAVALLVGLGALEPRPASPLRHLPHHYWMHRHHSPHLYRGSSCVQPPPGPHQLHRASPFWQRVSLPPPAPAPPSYNRSARAPHLHAYAAYWDERYEHVTVVIHAERPLPPLHCFFWYYNSGAPASAPAEVSADAGLARCAAPARTPPPPSLAPSQRRALARPLPAAVSLAPVSFRCGRLRNMLSIQVPEDVRPNARGAACVCAVWTRRGDAARRLIEWLTLLQHFGVQRVYLYLLHAHKNVYRVMEHYRQLVELMPYASPPLAAPHPAPTRAPAATPSYRAPDLGEFGEYVDYDEDALPPTDPEAARLQHSLRAGDLTPYNDCLLRARPAHDWAMMLDLDEILVLVRHGSYARLASVAARVLADGGGTLPDVLSARRYWYPQLLQRGLPPPPRAPAGHARAPPHVPPGRIFSYLWRAPTPLHEDMLTGKLLNTGRVDHVEAEGPVCRGPCVQWEAEHSVARLHWYPARCGGRARGVCRRLRARAAHDPLLLAWPRLRAHAAATARALHLHAHSPADHDND